MRKYKTNPPIIKKTGWIAEKMLAFWTNLQRLNRTLDLNRSFHCSVHWYQWNNDEALPAQVIARGMPSNTKNSLPLAEPN
jgi:hypothetical protein